MHRLHGLLVFAIFVAGVAIGAWFFGESDSSRIRRVMKAWWVLNVSEARAVRWFESFGFELGSHFSAAHMAAGMLRASTAFLHAAWPDVLSLVPV